jgi:hypothetical protein
MTQLHDTTSNQARAGKRTAAEVRRRANFSGVSIDYDKTSGSCSKELRP